MLLVEVLLTLFGFGLVVVVFYFALRAIFLPKPPRRRKPAANKSAAKGKTGT
jgi:hypothetical protein